MSDQDTPPPHDPAHGQDAPPPMEPTPPVEPVPTTRSSIPTAAPPTAGIGLGQGKLAENDERTMGMLAHILGAVIGFLGPLIIWLIKKDESPFVNDQGKESLNFQLTALIAYIACMILTFIPYIGCVFSIASLVVWVAVVVFSILGGVAANKGTVYRYPFALRLIS